MFLTGTFACVCVCACMRHACHCADWGITRLALGRRSWMAVKSLYILIWMMGADLSHELSAVGANVEIYCGTG